MKLFYTLFPNARVRKHFTLPLDDRLLVYSYIRKNACSAFKKLFWNESPHRLQYSETNALCMMGRYHKTRTKDLKHEKLVSLVVLRDPYQRLISLYLNKFIVRSGNWDIFQNYAKLTGSDPEKATFHEFLTKYVDRFSFKKLDCHLIPQINHMGHFAYNAPVRFEFFYNDLERILGKHYAEKYFRKKVNATAYSKASAHVSYNSHTAPDVLIEQYSETGMVPSSSHFLCAALENTVKTRYRDDIIIVNRLNSDYQNHKDTEVPVMDAHIPLKRPLRLFK